MENKRNVTRKRLIFTLKINYFTIIIHELIFKKLGFSDKHPYHVQ